MDILNVRELANYLKCSESKIRNLVRDKSIPNFRIGSKINFNKEAIIEDCKTIIDYNDNRISLSVNGGVVIFDGQKLNMFSFDNNTAIIKGIISNVTFEV